MPTVKRFALARHQRSRARIHSRRRSLAMCAALLGALGLASGTAAAAAGVNVSAVEGQAFTGNVVDGLVCSPTSATISWGDGTTSAGTSDGSSGIKGSHTYDEEGTYSGSVSYTYPVIRTCPSGTQTTSFQATVHDAPLTWVGHNLTGVAGQPTGGVVAHFSDADPGAAPGDFSAQIAWGDGASSPGSVSAAAGGGFNVTGSHGYANAGGYVVSVAITDGGGSTATTSSTAQIAAAPPPPPGITSRFIVNPPSPCILSPTLLDARDSTLVPAGTDTEYFYEISGLGGAATGDEATPDPVFDVTNLLPYDNSQAVFRGRITRNVPGFGPTVFGVFRINVLAPPVQVTLTVQQVVPGRGAVFGNSQVKTITFAHPEESLLIAYPGASFFETPPAFVLNATKRHGCPPVNTRRFFGIQAARSSVALATLTRLAVIRRGSSITLQVGCKNPLKGCFASLDVLSRSVRLTHAARQRVRHRLPPSLGSKTFVVPAGRTIPVSVHLNARGRALVRVHKLSRVTLLLGSVGAGGKIVQTVRTIRLRTGR